MYPILAGFIIVWIVCAGFAAFIAKSKNRDQAAWFILGLIFGIFALIAIAAVPVLPPLSPPLPAPEPTPEELHERQLASKRESRVSYVFLIGLGCVLLLTIWLISTGRL